MSQREDVEPPVITFTEVSDASGRILFKDIPMDSYTLAIEESYSYQALA